MAEQQSGPRPRIAMQRGDAIFLATFLLLSAVGFLVPALREERFAGVALFGWWMAGLMVLVPLVAVVRSLRERRPRPDGEDEA
ncbi:MAG: hypothetical protein P1V51_08185 [Deltaproteobacteria bacterium]|nr:hypothetical protein [Deltaproteobacteria bacterium]